MRYSVYKDFSTELGIREYIQSIKTLRTVFNFGLKESKHIIDGMRYENKLWFVDDITPEMVEILKLDNFTVVNVDINNNLPDDLFSIGNLNNETKIWFNSDILYIECLNSKVVFSVKLTDNERLKLIEELTNDKN